MGTLGICLSTQVKLSPIAGLNEGALDQVVVFPFCDGRRVLGSNTLWYAEKNQQCFPQTSSGFIFISANLT
jgi:hypothetical protein